MKIYFKQLLFLCCFSLILSNCSSQINLNKISKKVSKKVLGNDSGTANNSISNEEVIAGLKEALTVGIQNGSSRASKVDGFLKNEKIKLPFPEDAIKVKEKALQLGLDKKVKEFETTLNRAAEEAAKEAAPIFVQAIKEMSIIDGLNILKGDNNAATVYLKSQTSPKLEQAFSPKVENAINKVNLTKYWEPLTSAYNSASFLTGNQEINTDLNEYVTLKAIDGLFQLVEQEEQKIRKDPVARVTDLLKKVFGSL